MGQKAANQVLETNIERNYEAAIARWQLLIRKFHKEGDNTNIVKATKELDELLQLRRTNINISGLLNVNDVSKITDEDLDKQIIELEQVVKLKQSNK